MPFNTIVLYMRLVWSTPKQHETWTETQRRGGRDICRYLGKENSESGLQVPWLGGRSIPGVTPCGGREETKGEEAVRGAREGVVLMAICPQRSPMKLKEMRSDRKASCWGKTIWQVFQGLVCCYMIRSWEAGKPVSQSGPPFVFIQPER